MLRSEWWKICDSSINPVFHDHHWQDSQSPTPHWLEGYTFLGKKLINSPKSHFALWKIVTFYEIISSISPSRKSLTANSKPWGSSLIRGLNIRKPTVKVPWFLIKLIRSEWFLSGDVRCQWCQTTIYSVKDNFWIILLFKTFCCTLPMVH